MLDANSRRQYLTIAGMVILIVYLLVTLIDIGRVVELIGIAEKDELLLGIGLLIVSYGLISVRWRYLLGNRTGYLHTLKVDTSGYMLSILMQIPNAAYRVVAISKTADVKMSRATSAMVVDFLVGTTLRFIVLILVVVLIIGDVGGESSSLSFLALVSWPFYWGSCLAWSAGGNKSCPSALACCGGYRGSVKKGLNIQLLR